MMLFLPFMKDNPTNMFDLCTGHLDKDIPILRRNIVKEKIACVFIEQSSKI